MVHYYRINPTVSKSKKKNKRFKEMIIAYLICLLISVVHVSGIMGNTHIHLLFMPYIIISILVPVGWILGKLGA